MTRLSAETYEKLLDAVRVLYEPRDLSTYPQVINDVAKPLVPADHYGYSELNLARRRAISLMDNPRGNDVLLEHGAKFEQYMHQHPLVHHYREHPFAAPARVSDFVPLQQWMTTHLYQEFYRLLGIRYLMVTILPAVPPMMVGLGIGRDDADFTDEECHVMNLLRPHIAQSYRNATLLTDMRSALQDADRTFEALSMGLLAIDGDALVLRCTVGGSEMLQRFFPEHDRCDDRLPPAMRDWALQQIDRLSTESGPGPWTIYRDGQRLTLRLMRAQLLDQFLIHLVQTPGEPSPDALRVLGLSPRECQVLAGIVKGLTNPRIAGELSLSSETVNRHVDAILRKLGVSTRVAAAVIATECLLGPQ